MRESRVFSSMAYLICIGIFINFFDISIWLCYKVGYLLDATYTKKICTYNTREVFRPTRSREKIRSTYLLPTYLHSYCTIITNYYFAESRDFWLIRTDGLNYGNLNTGTRMRRDKCVRVCLPFSYTRSRRHRPQDSGYLLVYLRLFTKRYRYVELERSN